MATISVNVLSVTDGEDSYELDINGKLDKSGGTMTGALIAPVITSQGNVSSQHYNLENLGPRVGTVEGSVSSMGTRLTTAESSISTLNTKMATAESKLNTLSNDTGWVLPPPGSLFYRRVGLVCTVQVLNASGNATKTLFTLPEGCRPREDILVSNYDGNNASSSKCHLGIYKSGSVDFVCDDTSRTQYLAGAHATFIVA